MASLCPQKSTNFWEKHTSVAITWILNSFCKHHKTYTVTTFQTSIPTATNFCSCFLKLVIPVCLGNKKDKKHCYGKESMWSLTLHIVHHSLMHACTLSDRSAVITYGSIQFSPRPPPVKSLSKVCVLIEVVDVTFPALEAPTRMLTFHFPVSVSPWYWIYFKYTNTSYVQMYWDNLPWHSQKVKIDIQYT